MRSSTERGISITNGSILSACSKACWGKWSQDYREKVLDRYRRSCEKPSLHSEVVEESARLDELTASIRISGEGIPFHDRRHNPTSKAEGNLRPQAFPLGDIRQLLC